MENRYLALGPLLSEEGSRAFLGLRIVDGTANPCALVWVPEHVLQEPDQVERLRQDTSRVTVLEHPNIVRVHGLVELDEGLARAVEFADGESLRRILRLAGRLPSELAARIVLDAALGVQYAHLAGTEDGTPLVHGDLRPETLFVSYSGVTKVSGYGALAVAPTEIGGRRVIGQRGHCAPEQVLGGRDAVSAQTDIYLLGALLYEVLTGEVPFEAEKNFDKAVVSKPPLLLDSEFVPSMLRPVIGKAMAKKGNLRYPTVQAFSQAVEEQAGKVAAQAEVAQFLELTFKGDGARPARLREIERGLREWRADCAARAANPEVPEPPPSAPIPSASPESVPAPTPAPAPVPKAAEPQPAPRISSSPTVERIAPLSTGVDGSEWEPRPAARSSVSPWLVALPLAAIAAGAAFWFGRQGRGAESRRPEKIALSTPAAAVASGSPAASAEPPAASDSTAASGRAGPARAKEIAADQPQDPPAAPAQVQASTLEVTSSPALDLSVDGKAAGHTPVTMAVAPGKHRLMLADSAAGIQIVRNLDAKPGANRVAVVLEKGAVTVEAPSGCQVRIDGRVVGTTPLPGPVAVFEGSHRIQVKLGTATWQQFFALKPGEQMRFDVETQAREGQ